MYKRQVNRSSSSCWIPVGHVVYKDRFHFLHVFIHNGRILSAQRWGKQSVSEGRCLSLNHQFSGFAMDRHGPHRPLYFSRFSTLPIIRKKWGRLAFGNWRMIYTVLDSFVGITKHVSVLVLIDWKSCEQRLNLSSHLILDSMLGSQIPLRSCVKVRRGASRQLIYIYIIDFSGKIDWVQASKCHRMEEWCGAETLESWRKTHPSFFRVFVWLVLGALWCLAL